MTKAKLCFKCGEYEPIHPEHADNQKKIYAFDTDHNRHPVQIVDLYEAKKYVDENKWLLR